MLWSLRRQQSSGPDRGESSVDGGWDKEAVKFLKDIARLDARRWAKNDAIEIKHFFERLSVALQRGNASLLINRDADVHCL